MNKDAIEQEIGRLRRRLRDLDAERTDLEAALAELDRQQSALDQFGRSLPFDGATVTNSSPTSEKIALLRSLFAGRPDVFPVRWENRKTGRTG